MICQHNYLGGPHILNINKRPVGSPEDVKRAIEGIDEAIQTFEKHGSPWNTKVVVYDEPGTTRDSIFIPQGYNVTMAQLESGEKNRISHRAKALGKLITVLSNLNI